MPCKKYTFDQCVELHGFDYGSDINSTEYKYDADLLCGEKKQKVVEYISFATFAIVVYVLGKFHNSHEDCDKMWHCL